MKMFCKFTLRIKNTNHLHTPLKKKLKFYPTKKNYGKCMLQKKWLARLSKGASNMYTPSSLTTTSFPTLAGTAILLTRRMGTRAKMRSKFSTSFPPTETRRGAKFSFRQITVLSETKHFHVDFRLTPIKVAMAAIVYWWTTTPLVALKK
jgi:hypothetical protein